MADKRNLWQKFIDRVETYVWKARGYHAGYYTGSWDGKEFAIHIAVKKGGFVGDETFRQVMELLVETNKKMEAIVACNNPDDEGLK